MDHWGILIFKDRQYSPSFTNKGLTNQILFVEDKSPETYERIKAQFSEHYDLIAGRAVIQDDDLLRICQNVGDLVTRANGPSEYVDAKQFEKALELKM